MRYAPFVLAAGLAAVSACNQETTSPVPRVVPRDVPRDVPREADGDKIVRETIRQLGDKGSAAPREAAGEYVVRVLVAPQLETTLASPMFGRVRSLTVSLGSTFAEGKALVVLDCREQRARVAMAYAEVTAARENHEAKLRLQGLQATAEVEVALAAAALDKARAQHTLYRAQAALCTVRAPFDGRAAKVHVKQHQSVTAGQPLVDIVQGMPPKLRLNVPSKWLAWLTNGRVFTVVIDETSRIYQARVTAINARVDAAGQTIELEATVDKPGPELLPGMSGTAQFDLP